MPIVNYRNLTQSQELSNRKTLKKHGWFEPFLLRLCSVFGGNYSQRIFTTNWIGFDSNTKFIKTLSNHLVISENKKLSLFFLTEHAHLSIEWCCCDFNWQFITINRKRSRCISLNRRNAWRAFAWELHCVDWQMNGAHRTSLYRFTHNIFYFFFFSET